jgi:hypothetical protein
MEKIARAGGLRKIAFRALVELTYSKVFWD